MADSEKLTALKKAYAEIILNTAKEAAARIMASEMKAERYRRELVVAKDEALRMLLRVKHLLESKATEAEMKLGIQSKRSELLEAQLGEAEDIVKDLRSDLRELQEKLDNLTNREQPFPSTQVHDCEAVAKTHEHPHRSSLSDVYSLPIVHKESTSSTEMKNLVLEGMHQSNPCSNKLRSDKDEFFFCGSEYPAILVSRKEPELYRNGCTHRVRASETSVYGGSQFTSSKGTDTKVDKALGDQKFDNSRISFDGSVECDSEKRSLDLKPIEQHKDNDKVNSFADRRISCLRKRQTSKNSTKLCSEATADFSDQLVEVSKESELKSKQNAKEPKSLSFSSYNMWPDLPVVICQQREDTNDFSGWCLVSSTSSDALNGRSHDEITNMFLEDPTTKESDMTDSLCRTSGDKILKYTFHRKRKREAPGSPEADSSIESRFTRECINGEQCDLVQIPDLVAESSSELGRVERVACQLISLSKDILL